MLNVQQGSRVHPVVLGFGRVSAVIAAVAGSGPWQTWFVSVASLLTFRLYQVFATPPLVLHGIVLCDKKCTAS